MRECKGVAAGSLASAHPGSGDWGLQFLLVGGSLPPPAVARGGAEAEDISA